MDPTVRCRAYGAAGFCFGPYKRALCSGLDYLKYFARDTAHYAQLHTQLRRVLNKHAVHVND